MLAMEDAEEEILFDRTGLLSNEPKETSDIEWTEAKHKSGWTRVFTTIALCGAFFGLGLCYAIPGPTLLDLQLQTKVDLEEMSSIFTGRSFGYLIGSLVGGFMFDRLNGFLLLSFALFMASVATIIAPWSKHFMLLLGMIGLQGASLGVMDTGGNVMIIDTWGRQSAPYMQGMHFLFGLGAFVAPLISEPFLGHSLANHTDIKVGYIPTSVQPLQMDLLHSTAPDSRVRFARDVADDGDGWLTTLQNDSVSDAGSDVNATTAPPGPLKPTNTGGSGQLSQGSDVAGGKSLGKLMKENEEEEKARDQEAQLKPSTNNTSAPLNTTGTSTSSTASVTPSTTVATTMKLTPAEEAEEDVDVVVIATSVINTTAVYEDEEDYMLGEGIIKQISQHMKHMSHIQFAFLIIGCFLMFMSFVFMLLCCRGRFTCNSVRISRIEDRYSFTTESRGFRIQILTLLFVFYFLYMGIFVTFGGFVMTFAVTYLKWSKEQGTLLTSVFWGAFASGRGMAIIVSKWISPNFMIVGDIALMCFSLAGMLMALESSENVMWFFTATLGLGMASVFPTGISWAERYMHITGKSTSVFTVASALGEMFLPILTGIAFQVKGPMWLLYLCLAACCMCAVLLIFMQNLALNAGERYEKLTHYLGHAPHECDDFEMDSVSSGSTSNDGYSGSRAAVTNGYKRVTFNIPGPDTKVANGKPKKSKVISMQHALKAE